MVLRLEHEATRLFLSADAKHMYGQPIQGQLEIVCKSKGWGQNEVWSAEEGIYFKSQ